MLKICFQYCSFLESKTLFFSWNRRDREVGFPHQSTCLDLLVVLTASRTKSRLLSLLFKALGVWVVTSPCHPISDNGPRQLHWCHYPSEVLGVLWFALAVSPNIMPLVLLPGSQVFSIFQVWVQVPVPYGASPDQCASTSPLHFSSAWSLTLHYKAETFTPVQPCCTAAREMEHGEVTCFKGCAAKSDLLIPGLVHFPVQ